MRAGGGDGPGEAPAVAVEHRQRPEVDRARVEPRVVHLGERVQVRAAVRVHDALRPAGRPARVVDRDRVVLGHEPVLGLAVAGAPARNASYSVADHEHALDRRRPRHEVRERRVDDEQRARRSARGCSRSRPAISRVLIATSTAPAAGHAEVRLEQLGRVRREERDPVALLDPAPAGAPTASRRDALAKLRPGQPPLTVDDGDRDPGTRPPSARGTRAGSAARGAPRSRCRTLRAIVATASDTEFADLLVWRDGQTATITLNRPEKRNALSLELMEELIARARVGRRRPRVRGRSCSRAPARRSRPGTT